MTRPVASNRCHLERDRRRRLRRLALLDAGRLMPHAHVTAASAARGRLAAVLAIDSRRHRGRRGARREQPRPAGRCRAPADRCRGRRARPAGDLVRRTDPPTLGRTFGYLRLEIIAAVANAVLLFGVAAIVVIEAIRRIGNPPEVASRLMFAVALVGLAANGVSILAAARQQRPSLNVRGAYLEVMGDLAGSAAVIERRRRDRRHRLDAGRHDRLAPHRRADPAADPRASTRAVDVLLEAAFGTSISAHVRRHPRQRAALSTATTSMPGRSRPG